MLTGLPGIGKSALAAAYPWHFDAAHRAGVWWVSLAGCGPEPDDVAAQLTTALRDRLRDARVDGFNGPADEIPGIFAGHVARQSEPSLLVIDDIPGELKRRSRPSRLSWVMSVIHAASGVRRDPRTCCGAAAAHCMRWRQLLPYME